MSKNGTYPSGALQGLAPANVWQVGIRKNVLLAKVVEPF
jgi:hypothetical protein